MRGHSVDGIVFVDRVRKKELLESKEFEMEETSRGRCQDRLQFRSAYLCTRIRDDLFRSIKRELRLVFCGRKSEHTGLEGVQ